MIQNFTKEWWILKNIIKKLKNGGFLLAFLSNDLPYTQKLVV
jgi:hypothetical protein